MPDTEPMTGKEMARAVVRIEAGIVNLQAQVGNIPDWNDINRLEAHRDLEQTKQDVAIKETEQKIVAVETKIVTVDGRINALLVTTIVSLFGMVSSLLLILLK